MLYAYAARFDVMEIFWKILQNFWEVNKANKPDVEKIELLFCLAHTYIDVHEYALISKLDNMKGQFR